MNSLGEEGGVPPRRLFGPLEIQIQVENLTHVLDFPIDRDNFRLQRWTIFEVKFWR